MVSLKVGDKIYYKNISNDIFTVACDLDEVNYWVIWGEKWDGHNAPLITDKEENHLVKERRKINPYGFWYIMKDDKNIKLVFDDLLTEEDMW